MPTNPASHILAVSLLFCSVGCADEKLPVPSRSWHSKFGWEASDYFEDPQVIALCHAIEANDLKEIDRLVAAGADVNAIGKGNMTPLLWAFPDNQIKRFTRLLEHGADPNVTIESDFGIPQAFHKGDSVTHMSARTAFPDYFKAVMEHGADPNVIDEKGKRTLLHAVITAGVADARDRVRLLIDKGADLDRVDSTGTPPVREAVVWFNQFDIALMLLKGGADPAIYQPHSNSKLVHAVVSRKENFALLTPEMQHYYNAVVQWLEEHSESLEDAKKDLDRWAEWGRAYSPKGFRTMMDRAVAERKAREKAEAEKKAAIEHGTGEDDSTVVAPNNVEPD